MPDFSQRLHGKSRDESTDLWERKEYGEATPLAIFVAKKHIAHICELIRQGKATAEQGELLKSSLVQLVRTHYPVDMLLPVGWRYRDFPYLLITSHVLQALRKKAWQSGHVVMSPVMNMLAMILAKEGDLNSSIERSVPPPGTVKNVACFGKLLGRWLPHFEITMRGHYLPTQIFYVTTRIRPNVDGGR